MSYLVIALILALMLAPIFWIMPSPKQKRQTELRAHATSLGIQIKLCDLPQTYRESVRQQEPEQGVVYRLPWLESRSIKERFNFLLLRHETEIATASDNSHVDELMPSWLAKLPDSVMALELSNAGVAIYWKEQAGIDQLKKLFQQMSEIREEFESVA